jgi:cutinase
MLTHTQGTLGSPLGDALENKYGASNVWVQGVGGPYDATLGDNALPRGSSPAAIREGVRLFNLANSKCPNSKVVAGGYSYVLLLFQPPSSLLTHLSSQGAALTAAAISDLSTTVRNQVVGTVLFGYTQNQQNNGGIPNYPQDRLKVFCAVGDLVCQGTLIVLAPHLSYGDEARNEAPAFLISKIGN